MKEKRRPKGEGTRSIFRQLPEGKRKDFSKKAQSPAQEISEIMADMLARAAWWSDLVKQDWSDFTKWAHGTEDELARDFGKYSSLFKADQRIDGADSANAISILVAYCLAADRSIVRDHAEEAWINAIAAARWHGIVLTLYAFWEHEELEQQAARKEVAASGARAKLSRDPKQAGKARVYALWLDWQLGKAKHRSDAGFARSVYSNAGLEDPTTVVRWCRTWRNENNRKQRGDPQ